MVKFDKDNLNSKLVVIVDDEQDILELVNLNLSKAGFKTKTFENGESFYNSLISNKITPDLIILDLMLPDSDGIEICKYIKSNVKIKHIPIIILTAKGDEMDKIIGLEIGADDYVTKPFSPRELVARVKAVIRRESHSNDGNLLQVGKELFIDLQKYEVLVNNTKVELTSSEFKILRQLAERKGWVFSREQILTKLGADEKGVLDRTVDVHIKNLRDKLGEAGVYIKNIRGVGYKIEE